jgi:glycosyltransferase involved in cell wall biosynthesis
MSSILSPRVLFVSQHCPHGATYGAQLRSLHIARILNESYTTGMVLVPYAPPDERALDRVRSEFDLRGVFFLDAPRSGSMAWLRRQLDPYCEFATGGGLVGDGLEQFWRIAADYDLIWFHGIHVPGALGRRTWPGAVLDIDDIQSQVHAGKMKQAKNLGAKLQGFHQHLVWRRREKVLLQRFGAVCVCSAPDRTYLGGGNRIHTIPNGFESPRIEPSRSPLNPPRIGFIGTLNYEPNIEGLKWFIREVWPLIKTRRGDARLRLVGMGTDAGIAGEGVDIDGLGFVEDVSAEVAGWTTSIVPINVGGGTRIKSAEAFSRKCPVVSTRLGAYGYSLESGRDLMLADSPGEMADACLKLIDDPKLAEHMAERSWRRFQSEWSWEAIAPRVGDAVEAILGCEPIRDVRMAS